MSMRVTVYLFNHYKMYIVKDALLFGNSAKKNILIKRFHNMFLECNKIITVCRPLALSY